MAFPKKIFVLGLAAVVCFAALPVVAKDLPKERLVPSIGLLGTTADYSPTRYNMQRIIVQSWKELGIDAYNDPTKYEAMIKRAFRSKQFDTYIINWSPKLIRLEPNIFLYNFLHSKNAGWDSVNVSGYQNLSYDKLAEAQKVAVNLEDRKAIVDFIQEFLYERQPHHGFLHAKLFRAYNGKNFTDLKLAAGTGPWSFWTDLTAKPTAKQKIFRTAGVADIKTMNPVMAQLITDQWMLEHIYDFLMRVGTDGKPTLWAASGYKWIDEVTIDVTVREGMKFHDGKPVRVEDVKFSFDYFIEKKAGYLLSFLENVKSVEIVDSRTLRFRLNEPDVGFLLTVLCQVYILPEHIWSKIENPAVFANDSPIGSGPFKFDHWRRDEEVLLVGNSDHFQPPNADGVLYVVYGSQDPIVGAMERGEIDCTGVAHVDPRVAEKLGQHPDITVAAPLSFGMYMIEYNTRIAPFNDVHFRRAISYAIPVPVIIKQVLGGHAVPAGAMISPENKFWHNAKLPQWPYDMEKAREELRKAGYEWDDQGRLYYPTPENDRRWIDTVDRYPKYPKTWGKK